MDPQQIDLVKTSFAAATAQPGAPRSRASTTSCSRRLRSCASSSATEPGEQQRKLTDELRAIVDLLDHVDQLLARTGDLGMRHVAYGARSDHYDLVGTALLEALAVVLGDGFTPDVERAWRFAYNLVAEAMQQGATASTTSRLGA